MMLYIFGEGGDPGDLVRFIMNHNSPLNISILVILTVLATLIGNYKKSIPNKLLDRIEKIFA
ncbi:MAG: hypothetical protein Q8Q67_00060 [bacterium]|nr:hypothetical protein [bacterium]